MRLLCALALLALLSFPAASPASEVLRHPEGRHQTLLEADIPGGRIIQFHLPGLGHCSYMIVAKTPGGAEALVVDPARDVDVYEAAAQEAGARITAVLLTGLPADYVAGHTELAAKGARIHVSPDAGAGFPHAPIKEGDVLRLGGLALEIAKTPGRFPESLAALVRPAPEPSSGQAQEAAPVALLTGETGFKLGLPHWKPLLAKMTDDGLVLPGRAKGMYLGTTLPATTHATVADVRLPGPRQAAIGALAFPLTPGQQRMRELNRTGPPPAKWNSPLDKLDPVDPPDGNQVLDLRDRADFEAAKLPGAIHLDLGDLFESRAGAMLAGDKPLVLFGEFKTAREAAWRVGRLGLTAAWLDAAAYLEKTGGKTLLRPQGFAAPPITLTPEQIGGATPAGEGPDAPGQAKQTPSLDPFGTASSATGPSAKPAPPSQAAQAPPQAAAFVPAPKTLPKAVSAQEVEALLPAARVGELLIVDVREAEEFEDWRLPASQRISADDLLANPARLPGGAATPILLVDRDGSQALILATRLAGATGRTILVLRDGLAGYWLTTTLGKAVREIPLPMKKSDTSGSPAAPAGPSGEKPKTKSAGC